MGQRRQELAEAEARIAHEQRLQEKKAAAAAAKGGGKKKGGVGGKQRGGEGEDEEAFVPPPPEERPDDEPLEEAKVGICGGLLRWGVDGWMDACCV